MSYFNRSDLPYYYSLFDSFVAGDQYFQSTYTSTNPNRMHLFSGSNGLSVGDFNCVHNDEPTPGWNWTTMAEVLEDAGVSWKVYQQENNFDDNGLAWFANFQKAKPGDPLYEKGIKFSPDLIADFLKDMQSGDLPSVSWIVGPDYLSEHANYHPLYGMDFTARILKGLESAPEVYAKTVFLFNYDEGGQFFDHSWCPNLPMNSPHDGLTTVSPIGEISPEDFPIGLAFRVPFLVVSPWTRGNIVTSQVFDHTSTLQLIEKRFNVSLGTISPFRRAVAGDLTSVFDFDHPDYSWPVLPETKDEPHKSDVECDTLPPPQVPAEQSFPTQEPGTRISRALPYEFLVSDEIDYTALTFTLKINNTGLAGAAFILYNITDLKGSTPRKYVVEAGKAIKDVLSVRSSPFTFSLYGPNGFVRQFGGEISDRVSARVDYDPANDKVRVVLGNTHVTEPVTFRISDNAYNLGVHQAKISAGDENAYVFKTTASGNWYDFTVSVADGSNSPTFQRRFMGRMETGRDTISDPAMGKGLPASGEGIDSVRGLDVIMPRSSHPPLRDEIRTWKKRAATPNPNHRVPNIHTLGEDL